jgi:hypothetical protein
MVVVLNMVHMLRSEVFVLVYTRSNIDLLLSYNGGGILMVSVFDMMHQCQLASTYNNFSAGFEN